MLAKLYICKYQMLAKLYICKYQMLAKLSLQTVCIFKTIGSTDAFLTMSPGGKYQIESLLGSVSPHICPKRP